MTQPIFTKKQADHASEVVLNLIKERRFFLCKETDEYRWNTDILYQLDPEIFADAIELDAQINLAYVNAKNVAEESILEAERKLGTISAILLESQKLVQCNRYGGGLDICRVYPITDFTKYLPDSIDVLNKQLLIQYLRLGNKTLDDVSPSEMHLINNWIGGTAPKIWQQYEALDVWNPENDRCVVIMETRFSCEDRDDNNDFMLGKVWNMQDYSLATGYLFYQYCFQETIIRHSHVVFSTNRKGHVNMQRWVDKEPVINYAARAGYSCKVIFATIL